MGTRRFLPLGFTPLAESAVELDGVTFHTALLDFGPGSVDGWLATRVAGELGVTDTALDHQNRTVRTPAGCVELTRLEFGVLEVLHGQPGKAVTRQQPITKRQHEVAVAELETIVTEIDHVEITAQLARNAGDLAQAHQLRGYDAVHLAVAIAAFDAELVLVTSDNDLAGAARAQGLAVALTR